MGRIPRPTGCFLENEEYLGCPRGEKIWRSKDGTQLYTWDALHGEVEVFNVRGRHLGVFHATTKELVKPAVKGRRIDV